MTSVQPTPSTRKPASRRKLSDGATPEPAAPSRPTILRVEQPGWFEMDDVAYHADPCPEPSLSASIANKVIHQSLLHAWRAHPRSPLFVESVAGSAADRGSAAHSLLLGGKALTVIEAEDYRTSAARTARDEARASGKIPLLAKEAEGVAAMTALARARFFDLHDGPYHCERTAIWRPRDAGWRRARLDTVSQEGALIVDYKTTEAAVDAFACERRIADMGLQIQAAAYVEAVEHLHPELTGRVRFLFQWQEQKPPYALSPPLEMGEAFLSLGRAQWRAASHLWDKALAHKSFPGHSARPHLASPPPWELARWEERALSEGLISGGAA